MVEGAKLFEWIISNWFGVVSLLFGGLLGSGLTMFAHRSAKKSSDLAVENHEKLKANLAVRDAEVQDFVEENNRLIREQAEYREELEKLRDLNRRIEWDQVDRAAREAAEKIAALNGPVDLILAPGPRGAVFAHQILTHLPNHPLLIVGLTHRINDDPEFFKGRLSVDNDDWVAEFPASILEYSEGHVLVVDDYARNGTFMRRIRSKFAGMEDFKTETISCAVLVATSWTVRDGHVDYAYIKHNDDNFFFPWGQAV